MPEQDQSSEFPAGLLYWAGNRQGGVRRLFHEGSGRPNGDVLETPLLRRLRQWVVGVGRDEAVPRVILLIGGPGNGKTEAVETTLFALDEELRLQRGLIEDLARQSAPREGQAVPRLLRATLPGTAPTEPAREIAIVQDASVTQEDAPDVSPASTLIRELERYALEDHNHFFLACVNRGILDEAFIQAVEARNFPIRQLLDAAIKAVGLSPKASSCWPLSGYPHVAVWPMDAESLIDVEEADAAAVSPAARLFATATNETRWAAHHSCVAGPACPFCLSRELLSHGPQMSSLLRILRWYELATAKRWSFRDLFSLVSYLLAGIPRHQGARAIGPCEWAAAQMQLAQNPSNRLERAKLLAPFQLVAAQYQHALFGRWPRVGGRRFRNALKDLKLDDHPTLLGFNMFLGATRDTALPETLDAQLGGLCDGLDPALADPDTEVEVSTQRRVYLRDVDAHFSQSVGEGLSFIRRYLSPLEVDLLKRLSDEDDALGAVEVRRRRSAVARQLQVLLRDFSCRLVRRSLGVRAGVARDSRVLQDFERVIAGDERLLHEAVKQVEGLLNSGEKFAVSLSTTFGEALPPESRRATLTTTKQRVRPLELEHSGRPNVAVRFLQAGSGSLSQPVPLTYDLYRSVRELRLGMVPASLPRTVVALLDTTRARLAGKIVRDEDALDGAEIRLGRRPEVVVRELDRFIVHGGDRE